MRSLLAPGVGIQTYGAVLQGFYYYYTALEAKLLPRLDELLVTLHRSEYHYVPRSPLLRRDLADLRIYPQQPDESEVLPLPAIDSPGATLGVLYVLEGSTQGGRVIAPHLAKTLGLKSNFGGRFFSLHAADNRGWLGFLQLLSTLSEEPLIHEPAVIAARDTFASLHPYLDAESRQKARQL